MKKRSGDKRKREKRGDPGDIDGYLGKTEFSSLEVQCQVLVSCGRSCDKRKREKRGDPGKIDGYLGKKSSVEVQCQISLSYGSCICINPLGTGRKLNIHKTFRRCQGRLLNTIYRFNLSLVSKGMCYEGE